MMPVLFNVFNYICEIWFVLWYIHTYIETCTLAHTCTKTIYMTFLNKNSIAVYVS